MSGLGARRLPGPLARSTGHVGSCNICSVQPRIPLFHSEAVAAIPATPDNGPSLQALFEDCPDFFALTTGLPPGPAEVQSLFTALPQGKTYDDKYVISLFDPLAELIGVMDVVRDYPNRGEWWLGLLLLHPDHRRRGNGRRIVESFVEWVAAAGGNEISLAVKQQNELAYRFWLAAGFHEVGRRPPARFGARISTAIVMNRKTVRHPARAQG